MINFVILSIPLSLALKLIFIFILIPLIVSIIKGSIKNDIEKENVILQNLVAQVNNHNKPPQSVELDEFVFSTHNGLLRDFSFATKEDNLIVKIYSDKLEFNYLHVNTTFIIELRHIEKIIYSTENRGGYAIIDKYINLTFNEQNVKYSKNINSETNIPIPRVIQKFRIRENRQEISGYTGKSFEEMLIQTLEDYINDRPEIEDSKKFSNIVKPKAGNETIPKTTKFVRYSTDKGIVEIAPCISLKGQKAFINSQPAPDGKYSYGFMTSFHVKNGIVIKG